MGQTISERATDGIGHNKPPRTVTCPCCDHSWEPGRLRSIPQHRRFFALIKAAYDNWPESHDRQFGSIDECRKWLIAKAGYRNIQLDMPIVGVRPDAATLLVSAALTAAGTGAFAAVKGGRLLVITAKSIRFDRMGPQEFGTLCDDVAAVLEREAGIRLEPEAAAA